MAPSRPGVMWIVVGSLVLATTAGVSVALVRHGHTTGSSTVSAADCAQSDQAIVAPPELARYVRLMDDETTTSPFSAFQAPNAVPPLLTRAFRAKRQEGFVARLAFPNSSPPAHAGTADVALPLSGEVVAQHPAEPLEIWEISYTFASTAGSQALMESFRVSARPTVYDDPTGHHTVQADAAPVPRTTADDSLALTRTPQPDDGRHEHTVGYAFRWGTHVLQVTVAGGPQLSTHATDPIALMASTRLAAACSY